MNGHRGLSIKWVLGIAVLVLLAAGAARAQTVDVRSGGERVVVDGDTVRIEDAAGGVITGDWRQPGTVRVETDTEKVLVELGAVTVEDRIQLNLAGDILFDFDSSAVRPDAAAKLGQVAHVIRSRSVGDVYVIGHTDSVGEDAYNDKLSLDRAVSVMAWLNRHEGIPASVMVGSGMGARRPVAHNTNPDGSDSPEGRARNRRVEVQMATREGVAVGPDVVIAPGGVRVTHQGVTAAGGAIQVDPSGVRVGGVEVTGEGVRIGGTRVVDVGPGGVTVSADPSTVVHVEGAQGVTLSAGNSSTCKGGEVCDFACIEGDCSMTCAGGATCDFTCSGGDCRMTCAGGGRCDFGCSGGDCLMTCAAGGSCDFSCSGGDCLFQCPLGSDCADLSCTGEGCECRGPGC